jgi:glycosyltransferase involved in cell wall biosynthesis
MIEAMACGTPVIAHRRGSVQEVVDTGITGFHSGVIDGLAELVPQAFALDRAKVREHAMSRFGFQQMTDAYLELFHALARGGSGQSSAAPNKPGSGVTPRPGALGGV